MLEYVVCMSMLLIYDSCHDLLHVYNAHILWGLWLFVSDKVVCTAVIRVFGRQLAEVPLVATSLEHQGQVSCLGGGASNQLS
jgi:hypothetical protein